MLTHLFIFSKCFIPVWVLDLAILGTLNVKTFEECKNVKTFHCRAQRTQLFIRPFTPRVNLALPINLSACFLGGNWRTQWKPTWTLEKHAHRQ